MATKGVLIDINKKYKMGSGTKITKLELDSDLNYPIVAFYINELGRENCESYTPDGFLFADQENFDRDLILDEEQPQEINQRKVVQITAINVGVYALTDDGDIFYCNGQNEWEKLPPIPQD